MKGIKKEFISFHADSDGIDRIEDIVPSSIKVPKKAKGVVRCRGVFNGVIIETYAFCSRRDEWNLHEGRKIAAQRLYNVINGMKKFGNVQKIK